MLAILIVEDIPATLKLLRDYLAYEFPYALIDTAETVQEALEKIQEADRCGIAYKIAILDFMLPKSRDEPEPKIDTTLRSRLRESTSRDAVVFHITAYPDSPLIEQYLRQEEMRYPEGARPVVISKLGDESWTERLYDSIRRVVHGDRITRRLDRLFGGGPAGPEQLDATQELNSLVSDIEAHWRYLDPPLQARINRLFRLQQAGSGVTVHLL
jgi:CheY-like chemotaxis protein